MIRGNRRTIRRSSAVIVRIIIIFFFRFLQTFCDKFKGLNIHFEHSEKEELLEKTAVDGREHVEEAHRKGKGAILVGGHLGNWEMAAVCFAIRGYPIQVVARRIYIESLNRMLVEIRERLGVKTLYREGSMRSMIRCLQNNHFLAILPDQDVKRVQGIFVDFYVLLTHHRQRRQEDSAKQDQNAAGGDASSDLPNQTLDSKRMLQPRYSHSHNSR